MAEKKKKKKLTGIAGLLESARDYVDEHAFGGPEKRVDWFNLGPDGRPTPNPEGMGLGTMLMGQSPEEIQRWTEGNSPFMMKPAAEGPPVNRYIPGDVGGQMQSDVFRFKEGRTLPTLDTVLLGTDIAGLAGLATRGIRKGAQAAYPALNPEVNTSRRKFLGDTGKLAAGAAAAAALPAALRGTPIPHGWGAIEGGGEIAAARGVARAATHATIADYYAARKFAQMQAERKAEAFAGADLNADLGEPYAEFLKHEMDKVYENPAFEQYREHIDMERAHNAGMKKASDEFTADDDIVKLENKYHDMFERHDTNNFEFEKKHGAVIDHGEENWLKAQDPEYQFVDPKDHIRYVWAKLDETTGKLVQVDPRLEPDAFKAKMLPHNKEIFPVSYSGRKADIPSSYYEDYLKGRGHKLATGGSVTMPDNYRKGGRTRMI